MSPPFKHKPAPIPEPTNEQSLEQTRKALIYESEPERRQSEGDVLRVVDNTDGAAKPWEQYDRKGKPWNHHVTLRLNDHYMERLRYLAQQSDDLPMQHLLRAIWLPELEKRTDESS